jgi:hypothetical protein
MDPKRKTRLTMNQAVLRSVNEGLDSRLADGRLAFRCECGRLGCNQLLALSRVEYEAVRANPRRFAILPAHEIVEVESVVERHEGYAVVETHPDISPIAERSNPRTRATADAPLADS